MPDRLALETPLQIDCFKTPPRPARLGRLTAELVGNVLDQLKYNGVWKITFQQRVRKKSEVRFQVITRRDYEIFLRTKPGNNDTTWEIKLTPPSGYLIQEIYENLKRVPSSGIMRKNVAIPLFQMPQSKIPVITHSLPEVETPEPESVSPALEPVPQPQPIEIPVQILETPVAPQIDLPKEEAVEMPRMDLAIKKETLEVGKNPQALLHGLVSLCCSMSQEGHIERGKAVGALVHEMDLKEFIKLHPTYSNAKKVASMILKGLCDRGQISRYSPTRKFNRVRDTTKGYVLTPLGREKIRGIQNKLPDSVRLRLFSQIIVKPVKTSEESFEKLTSLTQQLIEKQKSLGEYGNMLDDLQIKRLEFENKTAPCHQKILSLKEQIELMNKEIEQLENELDTKSLTEINRDIHDCTGMIDAENHEVERLKKQIIELMG